MQTAYCWFELNPEQIVYLKLNNFPFFTFVPLSFLLHIHFTCPIPIRLSLRQCFTDCPPSEQKGSVPVQLAVDISVILTKKEPHHPNHRLHEFGLKWYHHSTICCYIFFSYIFCNIMLTSEELLTLWLPSLLSYSAGNKLVSLIFAYDLPHLHESSVVPTTP